MDIGKLLQRATGGDPLASREWLLLQWEGKALRSYPFGRKGPLDDGVSPIVFGRNPDNGLLRMEITKPGPLRFLRKGVAEIMRHNMRLCGLLWLDYCEEPSPVEAIESLVEEGLGFHTRPWEQGIELEFLHASNTIDFGLYHSRELLSAWVSLIEQSERPYEDYGFDDDEEYYQIVDYAVDDVTGKT